MVLLSTSHPVAFVQSKLSQESKGLGSIPEGEPANPEPATPSPKATDPAAAPSDAAADSATSTTTTDGGADTDTAAIIQDFKAEPTNTPLTATEQVTFDTDQEQTINSDTLHALVEQLRPPPSPAQTLEQIVIIKTVDNMDNMPPQQ